MKTSDEHTQIRLRMHVNTIKRQRLGTEAHTESSISEPHSCRSGPAAIVGPLLRAEQARMSRTPASCRQAETMAAMYSMAGGDIPAPALGS